MKKNKIIFNVLVILFLLINNPIGMKERVLVIGLDGATFDIINPLIEKGKLPNIAKIKENGVYGNLTSIIPPISSLAWPSFFTGTNPGKHGIFGFQNCDKNNMKPKINLGSDVEGKKIWDILSENGKKIIVMNIEMTYPPPEKVNGIFISGVLSPEISVYPKGLKPWLEDQGYVVEGKGYMNTPKKEFIEDLYKTTDKRAEVALKLMEDKESDWDAFILLFTGTDRIQHYFWRDNGGEKNGIFGNAIPDYYQHIDEKIGELMEKAGNNTTVFLISDHGFGRLEKRVHINNWLENKGYIKTKPTLKNYINRFKIYISSFLKITGISGLIRKVMLKSGAKPSQLRPPSIEIDKENTKAIACGYYDGQIYLNSNLNENEYSQLRNELIEKLSNLKDPTNGKKIFSEVHKKEDVYYGPNIDKAPDIILLPRDGYWMVGGFSYSFLFEQTTKETGRHEMNGILLAYGPKIKNNKELEGANLIDISPTILQILNLSAGDNMDGNVLDIF